MADCRSCHAPIEWARTINGKRIPLDPAPSPRGNLIFEDGIAAVATEERLEQRDTIPMLWISHFATCPNARRHRR